MNINQIKNIKLGNSDIESLYYGNIRVWPLYDKILIPADYQGLYSVSSVDTDYKYDFSNVKSITYEKSICAYPNNGKSESFPGEIYWPVIYNGNSNFWPALSLRTCISFGKTSEVIMTANTIENICYADYYLTTENNMINGEITKYGFPYTITKFKLYDKNPLKKVLFANCSRLKDVYFESTGSLERCMFFDCESLENVPLINVSDATDLSGMFWGCYKVDNIRIISNNATDTHDMFAWCKTLKRIPEFDTSKVTDMSQMFQHCESLEEIPLLNCESVKTMTNIIGGTNPYMLIKGFKDFGKAFTDDDLIDSPDTYANETIKFSFCGNLKLYSYINVINNLYDMNLTNVTITPKVSMLRSAWEELPEDIKNTLYNKGWDVSLYDGYSSGFAHTPSYGYRRWGKTEI